MTIDFDKEYHCRHCGGLMQVWMPILLTPGTEEIDHSLIDYGSSSCDDSNNWTCTECSEWGFPVDLHEGD